MYRRINKCTKALKYTINTGVINIKMSEYTEFFI